MGIFFSFLVICFLCTACTPTENEGSTSEGNNTSQPTGSGTMQSYITLQNDAIEAGSGVRVEGNIATVISGGTYEVTGALENGQIIVDTTGVVTLVLKSASITCANAPPLYIKAAASVTVTLASGTENTLSDGANYADISTTAPDATLFSKVDLIINGSGSLQVNANFKDGIASRDALLIESGNVTVYAVNHGIKGKDFLQIDGGTLIVEAAQDGLKATNDKNAAQGYVKINGGNITITAEDDSISAITYVEINGGRIVIDTQNNGIKAGTAIRISAGTVTITTKDDGLKAPEETVSTDATVTVNGEKLGPKLEDIL